MECCSMCFEKTLHYESPAHGGWGVIRMAALVPEVHMLFVSPFACGRHGALGGIINGIKDKVSYLFLDEKDIVSGYYEKQIPGAVDRLFSALERKPKVLFIFVSCLDDLLGTDHVVIIDKLKQKYPHVLFRTCHMNPIQTDTALPPGVSLQANMYSLLERNNSRPLYSSQINLIGNNAPVTESCELFDLLKEKEISVKQIGLCRTFSDFYEMSNSFLNIVLSPLASVAARNMEKTLGISSIVSYITYDPEDIESFYKLLGQRISFDRKGEDVTFYTARFHQEAESALYETAEFLHGTPVAIDFQAVRRPFTLAKVLLKHGFTVSLIASENVPSFEKESFTWLQENYPKIEVANPLHYDSPKFEYYRLADSLCIGFDCGYMTGSKNVVDIMEDESLFGFDGVKRLMEKMRSAYTVTADVSEMIREAKLVI